MKFSFAAILAVLGMADGKKNRGRKLDRGYNGVTDTNAIVYHQCVSFQVAKEDLFEEGTGLAQMALDGEIVAQKSYVTFNWTDSNYPDYPYEEVEEAEEGDEEDEEDEEDTYTNLFMMTLEEWFQIVSAQDNEQEDKERYCEACKNSGGTYDSCVALEEGERKLKKKRDSFADLMEGERRLESTYSCFETVDCETCHDKGCFRQYQQQSGNSACSSGKSFSDSCLKSTQYLQNFMSGATCVKTGQVTQEGTYHTTFNIYAGLICEENGYGVEIALFLDDECTYYDQNMNFYNRMEGSDVWKLFKATSSKIQQPYEETIECAKCGYTAVGSGDYQGGAGEEDAYEVNEVCTNAMNNAIDLYTCGGYSKQNQQYKQYQQSDESVDHSWYTTDLDEQADEDQDVCLVLQENLDDLSDFHVYTYKNGEGKKGVSFFDYSRSHRRQGAKMTKHGKAGLIICALALMAVAAVLAGQKYAKKKKDSRKTPLVGGKKNGGAMA